MGAVCAPEAYICNTVGVALLILGKMEREGLKEVASRLQPGVMKWDTSALAEGGGDRQQDQQDRYEFSIFSRHWRIKLLLLISLKLSQLQFDKDIDRDCQGLHLQAINHTPSNTLVNMELAQLDMTKGLLRRKKET